MEQEVLETMNGFFRDNEFATELRSRGNYVSAPLSAAVKHLHFRILWSKNRSRRPTLKWKPCA